MRLEYEYSQGEEAAAAWVRAIAPTKTNAQLLLAIEKELATLRRAEALASSVWERTNLRGYANSLARKYVRAQDID